MLRRPYLPLLAIACALCAAGAQAQVQAPAPQSDVLESRAPSKGERRSARKERTAEEQTPIIGEVETFTETRGLAPAEGVVFLNEGEVAPLEQAPEADFESLPAAANESFEPEAFPVDTYSEEPVLTGTPMLQPEPDELVARAPVQTVTEAAIPSVSATPPSQLPPPAVPRRPNTPPTPEYILHGIQLYLLGDYAGALPILRENAINGDPRSRQLYGIALFNGEGLPADRAAGIAWTRIAAESGVTAAHGNLAAMEAAATADEKARAAAIYRELH